MMKKRKVEFQEAFNELMGTSIFNGTTRDPKRIKKLLSLLEKYWNDGRQDQRFFQLVLNLGRELYHQDDCYGYEDTSTIKKLTELLE